MFKIEIANHPTTDGYITKFYYNTDLRYEKTTIDIPIKEIIKWLEHNDGE